MTIPVLLLAKVAAVILAILAYLTAVEMALPSSNKADKLPITIVCTVSDYQQGACL